MDSKVISLSLPLEMLKKIDEYATLEYQTRSAFIRYGVDHYIRSLDKQKFEKRRQASIFTDRPALKIYDFDEEFEDIASDQKS